jgi:hypothetical protein
VVPGSEVQNPRTTPPAEFDFDAPVDLTKATDWKRINEAIGHASSYAMQMDKDWYSPRDEQELWAEAHKVMVEEGITDPDPEEVEDAQLLLLYRLTRDQDEMLPRPDNWWEEAYDADKDPTTHTDHLPEDTKWPLPF